MGKRYAVYGIGNAIMDLQLRLSEEEFAELELNKGQMQLVDVAQQQALIEKFHGYSLNQASGGSAANTMIALSQLGSAVSYGCCLGQDSFGEYYAREMQELGVVLDSSMIPGKTTGTCVVLITPDAERTMNTHLGASSDFAEMHVRDDELAHADWLYIEGYLFSSENGRGAVRQAVSYAKRHGVKVALTFSDVFIVNCFGDFLREVVSSSDLIFANLNEAKAFTGESDEEKALSELARACPFCVMTLSERGAWVVQSEVQYFIEPFATQPIDDTGAGDMFAGGFLHAVCSGFGPRDAGRLAGFLASKVVAQLGPRLTCDVKELVSETTFLPSLKEA